MSMYVCILSKSDTKGKIGAFKRIDSNSPAPVWVIFQSLLLVYVYITFYFSFDGGLWDLLMLAADHCLSYTVI